MEIVIRAAVIYVFLWVLLRSLGKRELGEMTAFELLLVVVLGDLVQQGVTQEDYSVTGAVLAVATLGMLTLVTSYVSFRWKKSRPVLEGRPAIVIERGMFLDDVLKIERITEDEVRESARAHGIDSIRRIRYGVVESSGQFSFLLMDESPVLPPSTPDT